MREALQDLGYADGVSVCDRVPPAAAYPAVALAVAEALARVAERQRVLPTLIAELYDVGGDKDRALDWLERGVDGHSPDMADFPIHPRWRALVGDARYQRILGRLQLPPGSAGGSKAAR